MKQSEYSLAEKREMAREQRTNLTPAEAELWEKLRNRKLGYKFLSHALIQGYIPDFYCPAARLVIEVDGSVHELGDVAANDDDKERNLEAAGIGLLRFSNEDVLRGDARILAQIKAECEHRASLKALGVSSELNTTVLKTRSSSRRCASVDKNDMPRRVSGLPAQCGTANPVQSVQPIEDISHMPHLAKRINQAFATLVRQSKEKADAAFKGIDNRLATEKALNQRVNFSNWLKTPNGASVREHLARLAARQQLEEAGQQRLDMPSSEKKDSEAAALVTTKGLHIADQPRRA